MIYRIILTLFLLIFLFALYVQGERSPSSSSSPSSSQTAPSSDDASAFKGMKVQ